MNWLGATVAEAEAGKSPRSSRSRNALAANPTAVTEIFPVLADGRVARDRTLNSHEAGADVATWREVPCGEAELPDDAAHRACAMHGENQKPDKTS